ncbi:selenocysteine-specific translation elongation factor [Candidatus Acetothermia bacterium]|jgi:selenocysteine-specific elongation factor|nr:selenocysteine-specific translation elongation factor [Candidatus Acetothermia bacterium]MCI2427878.1 selenocysteine-specific translation elongation factor [Candidatus Acetothermia bacterium]MCI2428907.1 selenocysteine-specific translation elongation factor [Candidatus Acetothermia bacterium]
MSIIIATAGHVDHGKTALIGALTGIDTDRLKEEKEREMSIDLGFAFLNLPNGDCAEIIDVPGHEQFLKNMLAGIGAIDLVLFVIAADEGVMAQTREHLQIIDLLEISHGIIVITKADLVDEEELALVYNEIDEALSDTCLADAPRQIVSSRSGAGIEELKSQIARMTQDIPPKRSDLAPFLPIDRVFTIAGFGTVVTGTLLSGKLQVGDQVEILPQQTVARIRRLETHSQSVNSVVAGARVGIALAKVKVSDLKRGNILTIPGCLAPSRLLDARLRVSSLSNTREITNRMRIRLHLGTDELIGRVILLDKAKLTAKTEGLVQFKLEESFAARTGDRFIVRCYSPPQVLGSGVVLNPQPVSHRRFDQTVITELNLYEARSPRRLVEELLLLSLRTWSIQELAQQTALSVAELTEILATIEIIPIGTDKILHRCQMDRLKEKIITCVQDYYTKAPTRIYMDLSALRAQIKVEELLLEQAIVELTNEQRLQRNDVRVALTDHQPRFTPQQTEVRNALDRLYSDRKFQPPADLAEVMEITKSGKDIVEMMLTSLVESGRLIRLPEGVILHCQAVNQAEQVLTAHRSETITVSEFRDAIGTTRKYALPLLQYFDNQGLTRRVQDKRIIQRDS